jgi:RNA polymerase sigma factor (sigma-70 family)
MSKVPLPSDSGCISHPGAVLCPQLLEIMEDSQNAIDLAFLRTDPQKLLLRHQETIRIIVKIFIRSGMFRASEFEDLIQHLNAHLLERMPQIRSQYNGSSLFRTYLSNIIRHECVDIRRMRRKEPSFFPLDNTAAPPDPAPDQRLLIEHDIRVLRAILRQFGSTRPRLILCLKLYYRIPITRQDIVTWAPGAPQEEIDHLLQVFGGEYRHLTAGRVFSLFHPILCRLEKSSLSADSLRRWMDRRIIEILDLLNGSPPTSAHSRETLGILFEDQCSPFLLRSS